MPNPFGGGSSTSRTQPAATTVTPNPPSLLPEAREGFVKGQDFYKNILANPPVFGGPRLAGVPESVSQGLTALQDIGAGGPGISEQAAENLTLADTSGASLASNPFAGTRDVVDPTLRDTASGVFTSSNPFTATRPEITSNLEPFTRTSDVIDPSQRAIARGDFLDPNLNPFLKGAEANILNPIFRDFNERVLPGIRDRFISAGGEGSTRRMLSENQAVDTLGRSAGEALSAEEARIFENERALQTQAALASTQATEAERARATGASATEAGLSEAELARAGSVFSTERALQDQAATEASRLAETELQRGGRIFDTERGRQEVSADRALRFPVMDILRANQLLGAGTQQRALEQEPLDIAQQVFEEPIFRQSAAAQSLLQAPTSAGFPNAGSTTVGSANPGLLGTTTSLGVLALMLKMMGVFGGGGSGVPA